MGISYFFKCPKCGYVLEIHLGFGGFATPRWHRENLKAVYNGELGEEIQKFLLENPNGTIGHENILKKCTQCGQYETTQDLTMYLPQENISGRKKFKIFKKYPHKCKHCGSDVEIYTDKDIFEHKCNVTCPNCQIEMIEDEMKGGIWD